MERRAFDRIPANMDVRLCFENDINTGALINLSPKGMLINTKVCFPLKTQFEVLLSLEDDIIKVPVQVARLSKKDNVYSGIGVEIVEPHAKYLEFVENRFNQSKTEEKKARTFICGVCKHIAFEKAPINCPFCLSSIDAFNETPGDLNIMGNFKTLSEFEKRHFPVVTISKKYGSSQDRNYIDIHVKVGEIQHKMDIDDHISFIDFYFDDQQINKKCIGRINLNCNIINPEASLRFCSELPGLLTIVSTCNAHGSWMTETKL